MYYLSSPFFYQMNDQLYVFPPIIPTNIIVPHVIEKNQVNSQQIYQQKKSLNSDIEIDSLSNKNKTTIQKPHESKQMKETADSDYEPEKNELMVFYKKKNTESNLSNQIYSFMSSHKSHRLKLKIFEGSQEKVQDFYKQIKKIKKTNKKYMNRSYISELILLKEGGTNFKIYKRSKSILEVQEIRKALRILFRYFILNACDCGLLTSRKMNKSTLMEHFARKREIVAYMTSEILGNCQELN